MHLQLEKLQTAEIKRLAVRGFTASILRQFIVQTTGFATSIFLARMLSPTDFGVFGLVSLTVQFFTLFAGTGLGVALIRAKAEPAREDVAAIFTIQFLLTTAVVVLLFLVAGLLPQINAHFTNEMVALIRALTISVWLTSFRLIPMITLERNLRFREIAFAETAENLAFNATAVILAAASTGVWALVSATLVRAFVGMAIVNLLAPQRPEFRLNSLNLKQNLVVGVGFQSPAIIFFLKDLAFPTFLLSLIGSTYLGYFIWTRDLVTKFSTISALFARIAFPALSKLSAAGADLAEATRVQSIFLGLAYWPLTTCLIATSPFFIRYIFSEKWVPAIPFFALFASTLILQILSVPWRSLSETMSKWHWPLIASSLIAVWELAGGYILIKWFGLFGCGLAIIASNIIFVFAYSREIKRLLKNDFLKCLPPFPPQLGVNAILAMAGFQTTDLLSLSFSHSLLFSIAFSTFTVAVNFLCFSSNRKALRKVYFHIAGRSAGSGSPQVSP